MHHKSFQYLDEDILLNFLKPYKIIYFSSYSTAKRLSSYVVFVHLIITLLQSLIFIYYFGQWKIQVTFMVIFASNTVMYILIRHRSKPLNVLLKNIQVVAPLPCKSLASNTVFCVIWGVTIIFARLCDYG